MIEYIRNLTKEEFSYLELVVNSPYFTTNKNIVRLFNYLKKIYPDISEKDLSRENISSNVFMTKKVNNVNIRKLISEFSFFMEEFFVQLEVNGEKMHNKLLLLRSLRKRGLIKRYKKYYKETSKLLNKCFSKDEEYYINRINFINELIEHKFGDLREKFDYNKQLKSDTLDYYYSFAKLHTFNEMFHSDAGKDEKIHYDKKYYSEITEFVEKNKEEIYKHHPNLFIIYCVVRMFDSMDDRYLQELKDYLKIKGEKFRKDKRSYYYHYITQYYIQKINMGKVEYRKPVFEIYKIMSEGKLFLKDNIITHIEINNVANIALALKEIDWLENFLKSYEKHLDPVFAIDAFNLAKAKLLFYKKDTTNIFQYLNSVGVKDPNYYSHAKFLLGRIYFDLKNITSAKYIVDNLKQYLRVGKALTAEQKDTIRIYNHFLTDLIKVYESKSTNKNSMKVIFKKELDAEKKLVPNKDWFYDAVKKL